VLSLKNSANNTSLKGQVHIDVLDGLRGIAIIMVIWFHIWQISWQGTNFSLFGHSISLDFIPVTGFMGVELFFFISAFCLFYPYARYLFEGKKLQPVRKFVYKRYIKIVPSYILAIILILIFVKQDFKSVSDGVRQVVSHLLFVHNIFKETEGTINGVFWSLGVEVQFYVLFPLLCWLFRKKPLIVFAGMSAISIVYRYFIRVHFQDNYSFLLNQTPGFLDLFACGMLAAYLIVLIRSRVKNFEKLTPFFTALAILMLVAFVQMLIWLYDVRYDLNGIKLWQGENRFYMALILMILTVSSALSHKYLRRVLANRVLTFMSVISYNLYIWHQLIARELLKYKLPLPLTQDPHKDPHWQLTFTITSMAVAIAFSTLITYAFERPILKKGFKGIVLGLAKIPGNAIQLLDRSGKNIKMKNVKLNSNKE
jgi:peptidoglycan/LPS O-acetylase OafA/YrhL